MLDADTGRLVLPVGAAHADIPVEPLIERCAPLPSHNWPSQVEAWLAEKAAQVTAALAERREFGQVEQLLRVQVAPRLPEPERGRLMCTPYGDLLDVVLVLDHEKGGRLTRERADLLVLNDPGGNALANTFGRELPRFTATERPLGQGGTVRVVGRPGSSLVTSALLGLERFVPEPTPHGVLVGLPRYSEVLLYPVTADGPAGAARATADLVADGYDRAEDRCDRRLFWYFQEQLGVVEFGRLTGRPKLPRPVRRLLR